VPKHLPLPITQALVQDGFAGVHGLGVNGPLLHPSNQHLTAHPDLAFAHDADGFEQILGAGTLGEDAASSGIERPDSPAVVVRRRHENDGRSVLTLQLSAERERSLHPAVHQQQLWPCDAQMLLEYRTIAFADDDDRRLAGDDPPEAFAKQSLVAEDADANGRHSSSLRGRLARGEMLRREPKRSLSARPQHVNGLRTLPATWSGP
jgi:hypothetical protein